MQYYCSLNMSSTVVGIGSLIPSCRNVERQWDLQEVGLSGGVVR